LSIKKIIPLVLFIMVFCLSCTKQKIQKLSNDRTMYKSAQALKSCEAIELPTSIDFNGKFLYHFFRCFSDKTPDGQETMGSLLDIMTSFEVAGMENLTSLLKYSKTTKNSKIEYPLMRTMVTWVERGVVSDDQIDSKNFSERFGILQDLLKDFDPSFAFNLLLESQNDQQLQTILNLSGDLFNKIDPNIFLSYWRSFLENHESRQKVISVIDSTVNDEDLWSELTSLTSFSPSFDLSSASQTNCLDDFLVTYSRTDTEVLCQMDTVHELKDAGDRLDELLRKLDQPTKKQFYQSTGEFFKNITQVPPDLRLSRLLRFKKGASDAWLEQKNPLLNTIGIGNLLASTKVQDLDHLIAAIKALIEDPNIPALFFANLKLGNTRLEKKIIDLIYKGGQVAGCKNLVLRGTQGISQQNDFYRVISTFFYPHPQCEHELSPVISLVVHELNRFNNCENDFNDEFCISPETLAKFKKSFAQIPFDQFLNNQEVEPDLLKRVVENALMEVASELKKEPYYLRFNHLAYGLVDEKVMSDLRDKISNMDHLSPGSLALLDQEINNDENLNKILVSDFLEKIIAHKIERLKMISYEFNNVAIHGSDYRLYRVLSGLYSSGPLENLINDELSYPRVKKIFGENLPGSVYRLKETLMRAHGSANLFHDNRLEFNDSELDFRLIGDKNRGMTFDEKGVFKFTRQKPRQLKDVFSNHFLRFESLFNNGDLMGKDVAEQKADEFSSWIENVFFKQVSATAYWKEALKNHQFMPRLANERDFFAITPYTVNEFRKIAHFNAINYLSVVNFLPSGDENRFYISQDKVIKKQFMGPMINGEFNWSTFNWHYPAMFNWKPGEDGTIAFSHIRKTIAELITLESYKKMTSSGPFQFSLDEKNQVYDVINLFDHEKEIFKILQSLNLLTQNKNKDYLPVLSLKNGCHSDASSASDCPITFFKDGENEQRAFNDLKNYIADIYLLSLCPYLDATQGGIDLGIILDKKADLDFCNNLNNNYLTDAHSGFSNDEIYPHSLKKSIMMDVLTMGKSNHLRPGLDNLVSQIRYHKAKQQKYSDTLLLNFWLNSPASVTQDMMAYSYKFNGDHKGFSSVKNGLMNAYLFYVENMINHYASSRVYENAQARYGAEVAYNEDPEKGKLYHFIYDVIINTHARCQRNEVVTDWLVEIFHELKKNDEYTDMAVRLLINPSDSQTINMFKNLLGLFIKRIREIMEADPAFLHFTWQQKGNKVIKQALKQDIWWMLTDVVNEFTQDELKSFVKAGLDLILQEPSELGRTKILIKELIKYLGFQSSALLVVEEKSTSVGKIIQHQVAQILKTKNSDQAILSVNTLIEEINKKHLDFYDHEPTQLVEHFNQLSEWGFESMPRLMKTYQNLVVKRDKLKLHDNYLKNLINSFIYPFRKSDEAQARGVALFNLLKIDEFGSFETIIRPILFPSEDRRYQTMFLNLIDSLGKVDAEVYKSSILVMDQLLRGAKVLLNFITEKINWESETSDDAILAIKSINRLTDYDNGIWKAQEELLNTWLEKGIMYRQIPLKE